jgi:Tfp pilus assembly protein PilF
MSGRIDAFLAMLERGQDSALLRFSLGNEYLARDEAGAAATHLREAVRQDRQYSAAWKLLGKALLAAGETEQALQAWRDGIAVAQEQGDRQAAKEMTVFVKRAERGRKGAGQ